MTRTMYFVQPARNDDGWEVRKEGADQASAVEDTKREAVERGREIADNQSPSQLMVRKRNGNFQRDHTYEGDPRRIPG